LHDLISRFQDGQCDLDAVINGCRKLLDNQDIEDTKDHLDHAESTSSPIILDLDGNGVATTAVQAGAYLRSFPRSSVGTPP
jgi:hypothetical protein